MKFSALVALFASTQAISIKTRAQQDVTVSVSVEALNEITNKLDDLTGQIENLLMNPVLEE